MTPARAVLAAMLKEAGGLPESQPSAPAQSFNDETERSYHGLDEVNLLWGLSSGTLIFFHSSGVLSKYSPDLRKYLLPSFPPQHANRCQDTETGFCPPV